MSDDKKNIGSKNMKKFFKTPEELKAKGFQEYETFLNNYIKKRKDVIDGTPFIFIDEFEFKDSTDVGPMLFLGTPNAQWKQAVNKDYKKRLTFSLGTCIVFTPLLVLPHTLFILIHDLRCFSALLMFNIAFVWVSSDSF